MPSIRSFPWLLVTWLWIWRLKGIHGRLVVLKNGRYDNVPLDVVTSHKKLVDVDHFYDKERYRPKYENFEMKPLFIMTSEV